MKAVCLQMDMLPAQPDANYAHAAAMIRAASREADVVVLPELWDVGFFPHSGLAELAAGNAERVRHELGALAKELGVNIVAGSVATCREGRIYNTAYVFERSGECISQYDKTHLFSPMGEHEHFTAGDSLCRFTLDGVQCALIICYDIRFPELTRTLALEGLDMLFVVAQWPAVRMEHLHTLCRARAIENQMFLCCCNSCGRTGDTQYGGGSLVLDPWGKTLAAAGESETILAADCDLSVLEDIRSSIHVFADRRPALYDCSAAKK